MMPGASYADAIRRANEIEAGNNIILNDPGYSPSATKHVFVRHQVGWLGDWDLDFLMDDNFDFVFPDISRAQPTRVKYTMIVRHDDKNELLATGSTLNLGSSNQITVYCSSRDKHVSSRTFSAVVLLSWFALLSQLDNGFDFIRDTAWLTCDGNHYDTLHWDGGTLGSSPGTVTSLRPSSSVSKTLSRYYKTFCDLFDDFLLSPLTCM